MDKMTTIVIKIDNQEILVSIENDKVLSGSIKTDNKVEQLEVSRTFNLCGYPFIELIKQEEVSV